MKLRRSGRDWRVFIQLTATRTSLVLAVLGYMFSPGWAGQPASCRPTLGDYRSVKKGMRRSEVERRFGCKGRRGVTVRVGRSTRVVYGWRGHGTYGANIHLTFLNDRLADKSELGLRR